MKWTSIVPTAPGYYFWRTLGGLYHGLAKLRAGDEMMEAGRPTWDRLDGFNPRNMIGKPGVWYYGPLKAPPITVLRNRSTADEH